MIVKRLLVIVIALCSLVIAKAEQGDQMTVTLQSGTNVSVFKGASAFVQAMNAANETGGDIITLSEGAFTPTPITKSVKIYGAGYEDNEENGTGITKFTDVLSIGKKGSTLTGVLIEGLFCDKGITNPTEAPLVELIISKCYINNKLQFNSKLTNPIIRQCVMMADMTGNDVSVAEKLLVTNCFFNTKPFGFLEESVVQIDHSIIVSPYGPDQGDCAFLFTNDIFLSAPWYYSVPYAYTGKGCVVKNCILRYGNEYGVLGNNTTGENNHYLKILQMFTDETQTSAAVLAYSSTRTFELNDPDNSYVDENGTSIGPAGGLGWNKIPSTPVVKNLQLGVNGSELNVKFEAEAR